MVAAALGLCVILLAHGSSGSREIVTCAQLLAVATVGWTLMTDGRRTAPWAWLLITAGLMFHGLAGGAWPRDPGFPVVTHWISLLFALSGSGLELVGLGLLVARVRHTPVFDELAETLIAGLSAAVAWSLVQGFPLARDLRVQGAPPLVACAVFAIDLSLVAAAFRLASSNGQHRAARAGAAVAALAQFSVHLGGIVALRWLSPAASELVLVATIGWVATSLPRPLVDDDAQGLILAGQSARPIALAALVIGFQSLLLARMAWPHLFPGPTAPVGVLVTSAVVVSYQAVLARRGNAAERRAHHDELTGLPNRMLFEDRLRVAVEQARRSSKQLAVLFLDLDQFKNVNDSLGHSAGNRLLQTVARRLEETVRAGETVSRFGGDEFTVLLTDLDGAEAAAGAAQRLLDAFARPLSVEHQQLFAGLSIGVALYPADGSNVATLLRNADAAMYLAKQRGRRRFELYSHELSDRVHRRLSLETALHTAIERHEFELHYQPKVNLSTGRVASVEALLRWRHPNRGLVPPSEFIPVAEDSGLIARIGEWVLAEACQQARRWQDAGFGPLPVAVNLSPGQFAGPIDDIVAKLLRQSGLDPAFLELEITEGLAMESGPHTLDTLKSIRDMGVRLAIDDFGTGYAALAYLTRWPIDQLKIDQSFVQAIDGAGEKSPEAAIVRAVLAMARSLNLEVTAEGVETDKQLEFLRGHGCDLIQGHLFSRAVPPAQLENILMLENVAGGPGRLGRLPTEPKLRLSRLVEMPPLPAGQLVPNPAVLPEADVATEVEQVTMRSHHQVADTRVAGGR
jgi:diguanylate cyclase (GGDEF)-like protein